MMFKKHITGIILLLLLFSTLFQIISGVEISSNQIIFVSNDETADFTNIQDAIGINIPPNEYEVTIEGGIGITITVIYREEFDDDLNLSLFCDGFIIFAVDKQPTYTALYYGRIKMVDKIITIGIKSLSIQVLIDGKVVKEAEGMMIGLFVFL